MKLFGYQKGDVAILLSVDDDNRVRLFKGDLSVDEIDGADIAAIKLGRDIASVPICDVQNMTHFVDGQVLDTDTIVALCRVIGLALRDAKV